MSIEIFQIDAFAEKPFEGNPAAVCLVDDARPEHWMQSVAAEMNLAETAFVQKADQGFSLRWFTPAVEVDLCGHATLAAAWTLWLTGRVAKNESICFHTRSGDLTASQRDGEVCLDFPIREAVECQPPEGLVESLQIPHDSELEFLGRNVDDFLLVLRGSDDGLQRIRSLRPNMHELRQVEGSRGIIVTSATENEEYDFVSRFFAPAVGIDEDPVTGSAHCCLASYWGSKWNKQNLVGFQASARGGFVKMQIEGNRVLLRGKAVLVTRGELLA